MRILLLSQYFHPEIGASQVRLAATVRELVKAGHEVEIVTAMPNHAHARIFPAYRGRFYSCESWEGVRLHRVWLYAASGAGVKRLANYASFMLTAFWGLARAKRPDYLFVESPPLFLGVTALVAGWCWRRPVIFNVADIWPDAARDLGVIRSERALDLAERLEGFIYRHARFVTTVTDIFFDTLRDRKGVPKSKLLFLPNGVDTEMFRPLPPDKALLKQLNLQDKHVFLYAGTHGYAHGMEVALEAAHLLQESPDIVFLFVGDGSEKPTLQALAERLGLKNVRFLGSVPPTEIAGLYSIAVGGVSTLRPSYNTRPVKIFASMACGKPVVYCGRGEGADIVRQAGAGIVTPPEDPERLADAVRELARDPALAQCLGEGGRRYVETTMSWTTLVRDWLEQLECLASQGSASQGSASQSPASRKPERISGEATRPPGLTPAQRRLKRGFDIGVSSLGLLLTGWIIALAFVLASFDTRDSGFFRQVRVGQHGVPFRVTKIRTMRSGSNLTTTVTTAADPRVTKLGRFFRRTKIDELPQLVNVLFGQMSLVGPRPDVAGFADRLAADDRIILSVKPGITGPASLKYRDEERLLAGQADPETFNREVIYPDKVRLNRDYIENYSFAKDLACLRATFLR